MGFGTGPRLDPGVEVPAARRGSCAFGSMCETGTLIWQEAGRYPGGHVMRHHNPSWSTTRQS